MTRSLIRSRFVRGVAATAAVPAAALMTGRNGSAQTQPTLRVAGIPLDVAAVPYYALEQGIFTKHGLDVEIVAASNGAAVAAAVIGGSLDIGNGNTTVLATSHEHGLPFVMIAPSGAYLSKAPTAAFIVASTSAARTARDLAGKVIGVGALRSVGEIAVRAFFDKEGIGSDGYKLIEVGNSASVPTLVSGRIDALMLEEPYLSAAVAVGAKKIGFPYDLIGSRWIEGGTFCTLDFAKANPDAIKRFGLAIGEAADWANKNPEASGKIIEKYSKAPIPPGMQRTFYPNKLLVSDLQPLIDASAKYGVLKARFAANELFAPGFGG